MSDPIFQGRVKWFALNKGYGFITPSAVVQGDPNALTQVCYNDVYFHIKSIAKPIEHLPKVGDTALFTVAENKNRPGKFAARDVRVLKRKSRNESNGTENNIATDVPNIEIHPASEDATAVEA